MPEIGPPHGGVGVRAVDADDDPGVGRVRGHTGGNAGLALEYPDVLRPAPPRQLAKA